MTFIMGMFIWSFESFAFKWLHFFFNNYTKYLSVLLNERQLGELGKGAGKGGGGGGSIREAGGAMGKKQAAEEEMYFK